MHVTVLKDYREDRHPCSRGERWLPNHADVLGKRGGFGFRNV